MFNFLILVVLKNELDSSGCIATGWAAWVLFPAGQDFSPVNSIQTDSVAHTHFYPVDNWRGPFPGRKRPWREVNHLLPSRAEVRNYGVIPQISYTSL
jgi:hypothetical protein